MASSYSLTSKSFVGSNKLSFSYSSLQLRRLSSPAVHISIRTQNRKNLQIQSVGSTYGTHFRVTTFGESHGGGVGCIIDGCPPRIPLSQSDLQFDLDRRPGQSRITTPRKETDTCTISSGVSEGMTTGTPIHVFVPNTDQRGLLKYMGSNHSKCACFLFFEVGGLSSARETMGRVAAGALAKKILKQFSGTEVLTFLPHFVHLSIFQIESSIVRCPNPEYAEKMIAAIDAVRTKGDSVGGVVTCIVRNAPRGLGSPSFDKLEAELSYVCMLLPATVGFDFGSGFSGSSMNGFEHNDEFYTDESNRIRTKTNRSGGIQGGISNGEIINMRVAFEPTFTIGNAVTSDKVETEMIARGSHDPCVFPQVVPMMEAMVAIVLVDQLMAQYAQCHLFPINMDLQEPLRKEPPQSEE
ncbi:unnamed protein product [Cochlearia groenlandica]